MTSRLARVVGTLVAILALAAAAAWGCASQSNAPVAEHDWQHHEPDGGWQTYRPDPRRYDVDPVESLLGQTMPHMPTAAPVNPASPTIP